MKLLLYRIYQLIIMLPIVLVSTILTATLTIIFSAIGLGRSMGYYIPMVWARLFCIITLVKVEVRGRENISQGQSYVFVANHQGAYDIFSIYGYLGHNFRWMMKKSLEKIPLVGYSCRVSGHIMVDRTSQAGVKRTIQTAEKQLSGGMSVVVFPEGSRTPDGNLHAFKKGAYFLATEFNLPVVPITINGSYNVMPIWAKIPHWGKITLTIHQPIMPGPEGHDLRDVMDNSRRVIAESLNN